MMAGSRTEGRRAAAVTGPGLVAGITTATAALPDLAAAAAADGTMPALAAAALKAAAAVGQAEEPAAATTRVTPAAAEVPGPAGFRTA